MKFLRIGSSLLVSLLMVLLFTISLAEAKKPPEVFAVTGRLVAPPVALQEARTYQLPGGRVKTVEVIKYTYACDEAKNHLFCTGDNIIRSTSIVKDGALESVTGIFHLVTSPKGGFNGIFYGVFSITDGIPVLTVYATGYGWGEMAGYSEQVVETIVLGGPNAGTDTFVSTITHHANH